MATAVVTRDHETVQILVREIAFGVDRAVEHWMAQIDLALADPSLTSLGRLNAVKEIVAEYKSQTGKAALRVCKA